MISRSCRLHFCTIVSGIPQHCVGFTGACLTICKYGAVVATKSTLDDAEAKVLEYITLRCKGGVAGLMRPKAIIKGERFLPLSEGQCRSAQVHV